MLTETSVQGKSVPPEYYWILSLTIVFNQKYFGTHTALIGSRLDYCMKNDFVGSNWKNSELFWRILPMGTVMNLNES